MPQTRIKIGVIGAGDIGFHIASSLALKNFDITIYNRFHQVDGKPSDYWLSKLGKVMDINDATQLPGCGNVKLTYKMEDLENCHSVIITAGAKRSRIDETREELACKNAQIIEKHAKFFTDHPNIRCLIISNPVDFLTRHLIDSMVKLSGNEANRAQIAKRIIGVSYVDSMRLVNLVKGVILAKNPNQNINVEGFAIGEHGPSMVPLMSSVLVNGEEIEKFLTKDEIQEIEQQTILRGNDIIKLTGASSVIGPAFAASGMIMQIIENKQITLPCSVWDGERAMGQLVEFKDGYAEKIIHHPKMTESEKTKLVNSAEILDKQAKNIWQIMP